jgi:CTP synthase (UTP-ammonia lyase)
MARVALVGDRSPAVRSHVRAPALLDALDVDGEWVPTDEAGDLDGFDGVWLLPGSPYRSEQGALAAVRTARERGLPFLGTCGGFQHALLEFARNVCGLARVEHAEQQPEAGELLIVPLACSLVGREGSVRVVPGSLAERIAGGGPLSVRYSCSYGPSPAYLDSLQAHGLRFTGFDDQGEVRIAELPGHPFFLGTLFQPELDDGPDPHPLVRGFAEATTRVRPPAR